MKLEIGIVKSCWISKWADKYGSHANLDGYLRDIYTILSPNDQFLIISVSLCLHLFVAQGLFFDLLKQPSDKKLSSRRGLSFSSSSKSSSSSSSSKYSSSSSNSSKHSSDKRQKKKVAYVCSSAGYSASVKAQYGCGARVPSVPGVSASSDAPLLSTRNSFLTKTSQPCYDDNKWVPVMWAASSLWCRNGQLQNISRVCSPCK